MSRQSRRSASREQGFTLVELLVAMILTVMFTGLVLSFMINFWSGAATLANDTASFVTRQNAGDSLRDKLNAASHLISQNSLSDTYPMVNDGSSTHWIVIHAQPQTIPMPASGSYTPVVYYEAPSIDSSKNFIMNGAQPYYDEFILYLDGSTKELLLRTLVNPSASGDRLTTSCPAANASASCPEDTIIASDVSAIGTRYFSRSGNTIDYTSITDPTTGGYIGPDFPSVEVVELTVKIGRSSTINGGTDTSNETIVRVAMRNQ